MAAAEREHLMHSLQCEHSTSDPKRCRCTCAGADHGKQATQATQDSPAMQQAMAEVERFGKQLSAMRTAFNNVFGGAW